MKTFVYDRKIVVPWVAARVGGDFPLVRTAGIGIMLDDHLVGGAIYDNYRKGASICIHCAGEGPNWLTRSFIKIAFSFPFLELAVRKLISPVESDNSASRRFVEHLGFSLEATLKDAAPEGDILLYTMARDACRFVKEPKNGERFFSP